MSGRGRGWLNLNKNNTISPPGLTGGIKLLSTNNESHQDYCDAEVKYPELVYQIKNLQIDAIKQKQSFKNIKQIGQNIGETEEETKKCVNTLFELALNDPEFCSKLITICTLSVDQLRMFRGYFVQCMQHNFEQLINEDKLETNNIVKFRKFVRLLGEYCIKSHLQLIPIIKGFIICLKVLVKSADLTDIKLFTNQIMLIGPIAVQEKPELQFTNEFTTIIRTQLINDILTKETRLWLLLALDLFNCQFGQLSVELKKFYQEQLGELPLLFYQNPYGTLSVETQHSSKKLDNYQSQVNVLQVSTTQLEHETTQLDLSEHKPIGRRPILGAGARNKHTDDSKSNPNQDFHTNKYRNGDILMKQKPRPKIGQSRNGWEHDDRFETDYS